jgi:hypothetical protein
VLGVLGKAMLLQLLRLFCCLAANQVAFSMATSFSSSSTANERVLRVSSTCSAGEQGGQMTNTVGQMTNAVGWRDTAPHTSQM